VTANVRCNAWLGADCPQRLGCNMVKLIEDSGHNRLEVFHAIAHGLNDEHGNRKGRQVLLELGVTVHRQKYIKPRGGES
jgi:hypothetical protein